MPFTIEDARSIARRAHAGQTDRLGVDYMEHVEAVAAGVADFDLEIQVAAMLHDVVEDSATTLDDLRELGVPERALDAVTLVSRNLHPELTYQEGIARICTSRDATLVKISDNAHNSLPERVAALAKTTGQEPNPRYAEARTLLFSVADPTDVRRILARANPALLSEFELTLPA